MADIFSISENLINIKPAQLLKKVLSRNDIQKLMIKLNTVNQLGKLNENQFSVKLVEIGGNYSVGYAKSKGVNKGAIDLKNSGRYYKTFKIVPLSNGNAEIISNNSIHGSNTFLSNERWGEVEGLNKVNTEIVLHAIDEEAIKILLQ
tara:strand:+ start:2667 stop:3107 length:441 start_codon:yes stop_codon:yes gene_type:complete